jgi:hypothetical protein
MEEVREGSRVLARPTREINSGGGLPTPLCIFITLGNEQDEERKRFAQMSSDVELYPSVFGTALRMPKRGAQYSVPMPRLNTKLIQTSDIRLSRMPMSNTMAEYKHPNTA